MYKRAAGKPNVTANVKTMYVEAKAWQVVYMGRMEPSERYGNQKSQGTEYACALAHGLSWHMLVVSDQDVQKATT